MRDTAPLQTSVPIRLLPTLAQAALLRAHAQEYIGTINVLVAASDSGVLPDEGKETTTAAFTAALPSAVKNQALRDARCVWKRALALGRVPVLRRPVCQWNNQNWRLEGATLVVPVHQNGQVNRITSRCAGTPPPAARARHPPLRGHATPRCAGTPPPTDRPPGGRTPGLLRITRKRNKWIAYVASTLPEPVPAASGEAVMGVDRGIKGPAVSDVVGRGTRYLGNGRAPRARRRQFYARRQARQPTKKVRAVRKSRGKESRWMRDTTHNLSRQVVTHAQQQAVGTSRLEQLAGIRQRTTRPSGGAKNGGKTATAARKNNRMIATWTVHQLATCIADTAARAGIAVEGVDPAYTSRTCPACGARNLAADRRYVCVDCGWLGHRDAVGAINISRRRAGAGRRGSVVLAPVPAAGA